MKKIRNRHKGKNALELLEEATLLLRQASLAAVAAYCTGTFPFVLGLLFFWTEMSLGSEAESRLVDASFLLAVLYVWMKWWQAVFAGKLRAVLTGRTADEEVRPAELLRQGAFHSWSFLVMPVALVITIPFGWCFAFFQNVTVLGGEDSNPRDLFRRAARQAALWPGQNHVLISLLLLCWFFAYANLGMAAFLVPRLMKSLLGIDTLMARSNTHLLNSTFFFALGTLAWLCLDPLIKAVYLLRCFYGESLHSGADLLRSFHRVKGAGRSALLLIAAFSALCLAPGGAGAAEGARLPVQGGSPAAASPLDPGTLEKSIARTLRDPEFNWRLPRKAAEKEPDEESGFIRDAMKAVGKRLVEAWRWAVDIIEKLLELLPQHSPKEKTGGETPFGDRVILLMYGVLALIVAWGGLLLKRRFFSGRRAQAEAHPVAPAAPDLSDESVTADELPSERWKQLSDELFAKGERRLALRALYFAAIAHLSEENYLTVARAKSNREYEREVKRRTHALPQVAESFSENVRIFERVWYGLYDLRQDVVQRFVDNHGRIVSNARRV